MGRAIGDDRPPWWRDAIRDAVLLIAAAGALAWVIWRCDTHGEVLKHWPGVVAFASPLSGLVRGIGRVYRVEPRRQAPSIVMLIVSVLGLVAVPLGYSMMGGFHE